MKKHIALGLLASTLFLAGCCTARHVTQWEYKRAYSIEEVNKAAADGWILMSFSTHEHTDTYSNGPVTRDVEVYVMKRQKQ
jgi:hypothetical protein